MTLFHAEIVLFVLKNVDNLHSRVEAQDHLDLIHITIVKRLDRSNLLTHVKEDFWVLDVD